MQKRAAYNSLLSVATLASIVVFYRSSMTSIVSLAVIGLLMLLVEDDKAALLLYGVAFIFGPLAEIIAIHFGAWNYTLPNFLGIPIWLPFVWGNASLFIHRTYLSLKENSV